MKKKRKIKVRATKTFILIEKMQKEGMKKISKERKLFFSPNNLTKWKEGETFLGRIFKKKKKVVKRLSNFSFFGESDLEKKKQVMKKEE